MWIWVGDSACELGAEYLIQEATAGLAQHHHVFFGRYVTSSRSVHDGGMAQVSCVEMACAHKLWMAVDIQAVMDQMEFQLSTCSSSTLAGVCVVSDLDDGVSCAASSALLQELSWRVPELSRTAVGLVPLGGLQGMANYHAVLSMDASLRLADRFLVRGLEDAMKLRDADHTDARPFRVGGLWRYVAADLLVGAVNGLCSAAQTADDPASATGDWTDRTVSHTCSVMDLRSNMWRRQSLAEAKYSKHKSQSMGNSSSSSSGSSDQKSKSKPLRDTAINLRALHESSSIGRASEKTITAASALEMRIDVEKGLFQSWHRLTASATDLRASLGSATPGVLWPPIDLVTPSSSKRSKPELHAPSRSPSKHAPSGSPRGGAIRAASSSTPCSLRLSRDASDIFTGLAEELGPPSVVGLVFQSPYAMKVIEEVTTKALALLAVGAFLHNMSADASAAANEIVVAAEQIQRALYRASNR